MPPMAITDPATGPEAPMTFSALPVSAQQMLGRPKTRDMTGTGRYPPEPKFHPYNFYSCVRLGDKDQLELIMRQDPFFITQDNGAGGPIHFATRYCQLDMTHYIVRAVPETVNQRSYDIGWTPLHYAAAQAQYPGFLEIYEYLLSEGADPTIRSDEYDPYLKPGRHLPVEVALEEPELRKKILALEAKYKDTPKARNAARQPNPAIGDWWAIYDAGLDTIRSWDLNYRHIWPEEKWRLREAEEYAKEKAARRERRAAAASGAPPATMLTEVPQSDVAFLFPGQGSQAMGMLKATQDLPAVKKMLATAEEILGYDLLKVCIDGPAATLNDTVYSQPALFVGGLAAVEKVRHDNPSLVDSVSCSAGLSLGEYTALVFAGAMTFEEGLRVVKVRAESMAAAAKVGSHGMLSIVGLDDATVEECCKEALAKSPEGTVCQVANMLFPQGRVVSGDKPALEIVQEVAARKGAIKVAALAVSGAFHTSRMESAAAALQEALSKVAIKAPRFPVYSNVTGEPFPEDGEAIKALLQRQLVSPVKWEQTLKAVIASGKTKLHELGPGQQVKAMVKRVDNKVWQSMQCTGC